MTNTDPAKIAEGIRNTAETIVGLNTLEGLQLLEAASAITALQARVAELEAALGKYGQHAQPCIGFCVCGYHDALKGDSGD